MAVVATIKRGDTFFYSAVWEGAVLSELRSEVRDVGGELVAEVEITDGDSAGLFNMRVTNTSKWPIGTLYTDIKRETGGTIQSSETMDILVKKDVTKWPKQ